ncbi:MAG: hypothetical protein JSS61_01540 [Verrucomicrobia bacterium]|nr:hypothetical protein [Verrucomicrobiota bacterium]
MDQKISTRTRILFFGASLLFAVSVVHLDRLYFKQGRSFSPRFHLSHLPNRPEWDVAPVDTGHIFDQEFHYLAKGAHCFAFASEDGKYVLKLHRYPSHLRILSWIGHPFGYLFSEKRKKIKTYNLERLSYHLNNYKRAYEKLRDETGLIAVHLNKTEPKQQITLVDASGARYKIPLNETTYLLQHRAELIYPTLDKLVARGELATAQEIVSHIIGLISSCCEKGYIDQDPILRKNYGLYGTSAIHIDVGDLVEDPTVKEREKRIAHVQEMTASLRLRLVRDYPELVDHYDAEISSLQRTL